MPFFNENLSTLPTDPVDLLREAECGKCWGIRAVKYVGSEKNLFPVPWAVNYIPSGGEP